MTNLKLGRLPSPDVVKVTVALPVAVKENVERYMEMHHASYGQSVDIGPFIAHIVATFIARDRAFQKARRNRPSKPA